MVLAIAVFGLGAIAVHATDNTTSKHWHSENPTYKLITSLLPNSWEPAIREGATAWTENTDITFTESSSAPSAVYRGMWPDSWDDDCPPSYTLACTRNTRSGNHIQHSTIIFNEDISMGTSSFNCALGIGYDIQTIALHEFGHMAGLGHSTDSGAAMYATYNDCQRTPDSHDEESMDDQYDNHP